MLRKTTSIVLLLLWMTVIFMFSSSGSVKSNNTSGQVISSAISVKDKVTSKETKPEAKKKIVKKLNYSVRKSAHVFEYFVLGVLALNVFDAFNVKRKVLFAIILCVLYAASDEFHQLFVPGRSGRVTDVLIDGCGAVIGTLIIMGISRVIARIRHNKKSGI